MIPLITILLSSSPFARGSFESFLGSETSGPGGGTQCHGFATGYQSGYESSQG